MFYLAKILQALGLADIGYALFVGIMRNSSMAEEIVLTLIGFGVGGAVDGSTARTV